MNKLTRAKTIETKSGVIQIPDGTEYAHNALNMVNNNFLGTQPGIADNEDDRGTRVGDQINLLGVIFPMMVELHERYSDVTCRLRVVRSAIGPRGPVPPSPRVDFISSSSYYCVNYT